MQENSEQKELAARNSALPDRTPSDVPTVLVCVDLALHSNELIPPAKAIAKALDAELALVHVIETRDYGTNGMPIDPVEWDVRRREAYAHLEQLAEAHACGDARPALHLLEGHCADRLRGILAGRPQDIAVLGRGHEQPGFSMGETALQVLESGINSLLLVPSGAKPRPKFSRILVPLDCSGRSEGIMSLVERIARSEDAELILVHAVPEPVFTGTAPDGPNDGALKAQVNQRNERVAKKYLEQLCGRIRASGLRASSMVFSDGDVRRKLAAAIAEQSIDLLVLASHGHSGFADVPFGDVASFLVRRSSVPTLVVRIGSDIAERHVFADARPVGGLRLGTLEQ